MRNIYISVLFVAGMAITVSSSIAQSLLPNNQFIYNKYSLNPAYAGYEECFEGYFTSRQNWSGFENAPRTSIVSVNGPVCGGSGIGGYITNDQYGIFQNTRSMLTYGYHIKLGQNQKLHFGLSAGLLHSNINYSAISNRNNNNNNGNSVNDPVIFTDGRSDEWAFDAAFGIVYQYKNWNVGMAFPSILEVQVRNASNSMKFYASNIFNINKNLQIEPSIVVDMPDKNSVLFDISAVAVIQKQVRLGLQFSKWGTFGIAAGFLFNRYSLGYSYEFSTTGPLGNSSGSHEITLGVILGKSSKINNKIPFVKSGEPYNDWVE